MKQINIHNSTVYYDDWNIDEKPELKEFIEGEAIKTIITSIPQDIIMVLGGDGTMLEWIWKYHNDGRPFLWINFGHKWFLLNDQKWIWDNTEFLTRNYPLLEVTCNGEFQWVAFNDVNIYSPSWKVLKLDISREDIWKIEFKWDGAIVCTPAGSTGHSNSYRWPALPHEANMLIITPKWNIEDETPKLILWNEKPLIIQNIKRKFKLAVNIDGGEDEESGDEGYVSQYGESVTIEIKKIPNRVKLLISQNHIQNWDNKVMQAQWFN